MYLLHFDSRLSNMRIQYTGTLACDSADAAISIQKYRLGFLKSTCRLSKIYAWIFKNHMLIILEISLENPRIAVKAKFHCGLIFGIKNLT